ncbi:MAG TPA: hypothetical protein PKN95_08730 [Verrucomicrobiota bacterium]|nr:hypothetical protein [Verrucomicrobiota bacterium]HNT15749.1 hypothetical protein [Verrucomicrobiota bacterium]
MKTFTTLVQVGAVLGILFPANFDAHAQRQLPADLKDWQDWATWEVKHRDCPTPFNDAAKHLCFWPGQLSLQADQKAATWELAVTVFSKTWVPLPGGGDLWPVNLTDGGVPVVAVERNQQPAVELAPGLHRISGAFHWEAEMPQAIRIPREVGVLALEFEGKRVEIPNWDESGNLWLKRVRVEATDRDMMTAQVWRVLEDGIPLWLRTEIELSVSGKSREEELGNVLPAGWQLSYVDAPVPVAVDDQGRLRAQVRAGKWIIHVDAFRTTDAGDIQFAPGAKPVVATELVGFQTKPEFRLAELEGLVSVDVSQTTFPQKWRTLPVYQWPTGQAFRLVEKMRGMGLQKPEGLRINRVLWLDENGRGLTFRDQINGAMQQIWRLDAAEGQELGAAKIGGQPQLITVNPANGAPGVEIRARNLDLQAIGRSVRASAIPATGWRASADGLNITVNLPPGWRLFALFGADWVVGDWLSAWTLLDLFLLLIFSLAVFKLWGWRAGLVALLAFGLAYQEPWAPRLVWFFLLVPLALLRVVPAGIIRKLLDGWRWLAILALLLWLTPFVATQLRGVIHPQLETQGQSYGTHPLFWWEEMTGGRARAQRKSVALSAPAASTLPALVQESADEGVAVAKRVSAYGWGGLASRVSPAQLEGNLLYDAKAKIQTGPAEPEWKWNEVTFGWNGPVSADEKFRPLFIPLGLHRILSVLRVALLVWLGALLLRRREPPAGPPAPGASTNLTAALVALMLTLFAPVPAAAEYPNKELLNTLRDRLLKPSDAYPRAAEIPTVDLQVTEGGIVMNAEIHAAIPVAVPLPGKLPAWSPVSVQLDDKSEAVLRRSDGYLWLVVPAGVHRVHVTGLLPATTEWEWAFLLKPRHVSITAPGWTVTGVRPNGVPENQVFFVRQREATAGEVEYDRKDFNAIVAVNRQIEVGLVWQVHNVVTRLSSPGKAIALRIPLLPGEKVLTGGVVVEDGGAEVRLAAGQAEFAWESELPVGEKIALKAEPTDRWVERWRLVTSPVWNAAMSGVSPVFESTETMLAPVWHPWPGEEVTLTFSKPEAVKGDTVTVRQVNQEVSLGSRQRTVKLTLNVEASLGNDFVLDLDPQAEITALKQDEKVIPVRRDGARLIVPVHPGSQVLHIEWRANEPLALRTRADRVQLSVEAANITTVLRVPESRWVLWTAGPLRGPAVQFWSVLAVALLAAWVLGRLKLSPISRWQWLLLLLGLTQTYLLAGMVVIGWFFLIAWRGKHPQALPSWRFNLFQVFLGGLTLTMLIILVATVAEGLLGNPEMFIRGNGSTRTALQWFQPRSGPELPQPAVISVSVWFYRLLMLAWALWLALALIRWLKWAWQQFNLGGCWQRVPAPPAPPPSVPPPLLNK